MRAEKCDKAIAEYQNILEKKEAVAEYDGERLDQFFLFCIFLLQVRRRTYGSLLSFFIVSQSSISCTWVFGQRKFSVN